MGALNFMRNVGVNERSLLWSSRTNVPELGHKHGFTTRFLCFRAQALDKIRASMLCVPT
jgi:hypothetical protein